MTGFNILAVVILMCGFAHAQYLQGGYDAFRSSQISFSKSHAKWTGRIPYSSHTNLGIQEPIVFDTVGGKSYSQYTFLPNFSIVQVDLISGKSNLINITVPNIDKYDEFNGIQNGRLDSKGNYFVVAGTLYDTVVIRVDISARIGKIVSFGTQNIYTTLISETDGLYIIGTSNNIIALDSTTLSQKWIIKAAGTQLLLVNSEINGYNVLYATDGQVLNRILAANGKILSSYKAKHKFDDFSYVRGLNGWLAVTLANTTSVYSGFVNVDKQVETTSNVLNGEYDPHFPSASSGCGYPMATANQTGNIISVTSVAKCTVPSGGYYETDIVAVRSLFDSNTMKPLAKEPTLIWKTSTSTGVSAQVDSRTFLSVEDLQSTLQYDQYDIYSGKVVKSVLSSIPGNMGTPVLVTSTNKKVYSYCEDRTESVDL